MFLHRQELPVSGECSFPRGFDPDFDDRDWNDDWLRLPVAQVPPGVHPGGYRVERRLLDAVPIFDRAYRLSAPLDCRLLYDPQGRLWMSDTPQERIMMVNNGRRSSGHVLIGGLGLGLYPQVAQAGSAGAATRFTVIERSPVVVDIVTPTLEAALDAPLTLHIGDAAEFLAGPVGQRFDTVFLDTWDTLDAAHLPMVNALRDLALRHLTPEGRVLLWGYGWMLALFEDACRQILALPPGARHNALAAQAHDAPRALALLGPVLDRFAGEPVAADIEAALGWCRGYALHVTEPVEF